MSRYFSFSPPVTKRANFTPYWRQHLAKLSVAMFMGLMAIFASNQAHADKVYDYVHADKLYAYFAGTTNVPDATVRINETVGKTDNNGAFGFHAKKAERYAVSVSKPGYALASQIEQAPNTMMNFTLKKADVIELSANDLANGVVVEDSRKTQIDLPPGAFGDVDEPVNAYVYTYDLANEAMPGDMSVAGRDGYLESAGVFSAEFVGKNSGKYYNLAAGKQASISMPAVVGNELPALWHYDETTGLWVEGQSETVNFVNGRLQGKVEHFSTWNFDWYKSNPACFTINATDSFFAAYGNSVRIKAVVKNTSFGTRARTGNLNNSNANARFATLINLPPNSKVDVYVQPPKEPDGQQPPLALLKENASIGAGSYNRNCKSVNLNGTPLASSDGSALQITGNGEGIFFSWLLQEIDKAGNILKSYANSDTQTIDLLPGIMPPVTIPTDTTDSSYESLQTYHITATGISSSLVALRLAADIKRSGGPDLVSEGNIITLPTSENDNTEITYVLYVGQQGETEPGQMCQVNSSSSCKFNPIIKLISMKQALTSIRGFVWRDDVKADGLQGVDEKPLNGFAVKLSPGNRTTRTNKNGYYEFTGLSAGTYTVSLDDSIVQVYTTSETITRTVGNIYTDENIKIPRTANFGIKELSIITLNTVGRGTVVATLGPHTVSCNEVCSGFTVTSGATLSLEAKPASGYSFVEWQDDCANTESTTSLTMDSDKICTVVLKNNNPDNTGGGNTGGGNTGNTGGGTTGNTNDDTGNTGGTTNNIGGSTTNSTVVKNFDGNGDGVVDTQQTDVVSVKATVADSSTTTDPNPTTNDVKLTLETSNGCALNNVQIKQDASLSASEDVSYPFGLVQFEAACVETTVTMFYYLDTNDEAYTFGSALNDDNSDWYALEGTTTELVTVNGKQAIKSSFSLKDGELGDNSGVDGRIVNISGLALTEKVTKKVVDVWVSDPPPDDGTEPGKATRIWASPDVWVRNEDDDVKRYQNVKHGQDNYVYVNVRNRGTLIAENTKVQVYRSGASMGQGWPNGWGVVGTGEVASLAPGASEIVKILWEKDNIPKPGHYCFYVRLLNDDDPMFAEETNNMVQNTRTNNNVAWRNFNVVGLLTQVTDQFEVNIGNPTDEDVDVELVFDEKEKLLQNDGAKAIVDLGATLFQRWQAAGGQGENLQLLSDTEVQLLATPAKFIGIPLKVGETLPITMRVDATQPMPGAGVLREYLFSAQEFINNELVGGVDYTITTRAQDTDSDGDGIKDVDDEDNDNDGIPDDWEIANDLNPLDPEDAAKDSDGDGLSNLEEFTQETNPKPENGNYVSSGIIRDDLGNPIVGVTVQLGDRTTTTDETGRWEITGLLEGEYTVTASKDGYPFAPANCALGNDENCEVTFGKTDSVLTVNMVANPSKPQQGEDVIYTITVMNGGEQTATGVVLSDVLPENVELISMEALDGSICDADARTVTCNLPDLTTGNSARVKLKISNNQGNRLENRVQVVSNEYPTDVAEKRTTVIPHLAVTMSCTPKQVQVQETLHCSALVELSSLAPSDATGVTLVMTAPNNVELKSISTDYGMCDTSNLPTVVCSLTDLSVNSADATSTVTVEMDNLVIDPGLLVLKHQAKVSANEYGIYKRNARNTIFVDGIKVDLAFVIDVTGSMQAEINGVIKALKEAIAEIDANNAPLIALVTFRDEDEVELQALTSDLDALLGVIEKLKASGGGTCHEASVEALNLVIPHVKEGGSILFATDASAYPDADIDAVIEQLRAKSISFNGMITGDCTDKNSWNDLQ
jgi:uncharacterized repeat protein (TIGR01451 family)